MITNTHPLVLRTLYDPIVRERHSLLGSPSLKDRVIDFIHKAITTNGTADDSPLSAFELLQRTYLEFQGDGDSLEIVFVDPEETDYMKINSQRAYTVIADDSDHHRSKQGEMQYGTAKLIDVDGKGFLIAFGVKGGDYPGDRFAGDLLVDYLGPRTVKESILDVIEEGKFDLDTFVNDMRNIISGRRNRFNPFPRMGAFSDSIAIAMRDGSFDYHRYGIGSRFSKLVADELDGLAIPDSRIILYRPEALDVIKRGMNVTLKDYLKED